MGDIDGSGQVTEADTALQRDLAGQDVTAVTARCDLDASGTITGADLLATRALIGHTLP